MSHENLRKAFDYTMEKADRLIRIVELKDAIRQSVQLQVDSFPEIFPGAPGKLFFTQGIKEPLDEFFSLTDEGILEQAISMSVTALETFLRDIYESLAKKETRPAVFQKLKVALDRLAEVEVKPTISPQLMKDVSFIIQRRHIIVHNSGLVDKKFIQNCDNEGLWDSTHASPQMEYVRNSRPTDVDQPDGVHAMLDSVIRCVDLVENQVQKIPD